MSDFLPLADHLLNRARLLLQVGRTGDARHLLRRALLHSEMPNRLRSDVLRMLAGIELTGGRFRRARRMLVAAIRLRRHADELYVEYARAVSADPDGDPRLAVKALRQAVRIDPVEARSWAALGTAAIRAGEIKLARKAFRRAARLHPESMATLNEIVEGLVHLGREREAQDLLSAARFRALADAGVMGVWKQFRFTLAHRQQSAARGDEPTVLPFALQPRQSDTARGEAVVLRADRKSTPAPHLLRMLGQRFDPRRAQ